MVPFRVVAVLMIFGCLAFAADPPEVKAKKLADNGWEVRTTGGEYSTVTPLDTELSLETRYGTVKLPMKDVRRVEFGVRVTVVQQRKIIDALADVIGGNGRTREAGKDALLELGLIAYPSVTRAQKTAPKDALPHLQLVHEKLARQFGVDDEPPADADVIYTTDGSKLSGNLIPAVVRVKAGDKEKGLDWTDTRVMAFGDVLEDEKVEVVALGPNGIFGLMQTHFDKVVGVEVTGTVGGSVWGSNPYTTDSMLAAAAVHSGVVKEGETAVIKLRVKADAGGYSGSTKNGVTTSNWGAYQGCFEIIAKANKKGR